MIHAYHLNWIVPLSMIAGAVLAMVLLAILVTQGKDDDFK